MKYLYYNGDSFCGDGVTQWEEDTDDGEVVVESSDSFGQLLGDKYNLEVNHAWQGGSSSHRTHRTTINHIMNNQSKLQDTLFLIGWTKPTRFELYNSLYEDYTQFGHQNFYEHHDEDFEYDITEEFQREYITKFCDIDIMLEDHLRRVYSLECILKANNCKYLFWNVFHDTCILHPDLPDTIPLWNKAVEIFDWENWILPDSSFDEYLEQFPHGDVRQKPSAPNYLPDDHPNELGHKQIAKFLIQELNL